jgi:hypothetical protein
MCNSLGRARKLTNWAHEPRRDDRAERERRGDGGCDRDTEGEQGRAVKCHVEVTPDVGRYIPQRAPDVPAEDPRTEQQRNDQQRAGAREHDQQLTGQQFRAQTA